MIIMQYLNLLHISNELLVSITLEIVFRESFTSSGNLITISTV